MSLRVLAAAVLLLGALGFGYLAFLSVQPPPPPPEAAAPAPPAPPARLLAATQPLQAGTLLKDDDLREVEPPEGRVPDGALIANPDQRAELRGAMLRRYLAAGELVGRGDVLRSRDRGFLAAVMRSGYRAVSVGVDAVTGAGGLIAPGDLVDVILTQDFGGNEGAPGRRVVGETVLTSVRVIAVDQQITQGGAPGGGAATGVNAVPRTVTLEVVPQQAERVAVAQRLGRLTLAVRSIDGPDPEPVDRPTTITGADVSPALQRDERPDAPRLRLIQGNNSSEVVFR